MPSILKLLLITFATFAAHTGAVEITCDEDLVLVRGARIEVKPTGADDTETVQCALQEAARVGVQSVRLLEGDFSISKVNVSDFIGQFAGSGRSNTQLTVGSPCPESDDENTISAAITFENGNVEVRNMAVTRSDSCAAAYDALFWFTGDPSDCNERTVFANVDRVDVTSAANDDNTAVINLRRPETCSESSSAMTGSLRVNRLNYVSEGDNAGIFASMTDNASITVTNSQITSDNCFTLFGKSRASIVMRGNECYFADYAVAATTDTNEQSQFSLQDNTFEATSTTDSTSINLSASSGLHTVTGNKLITTANTESTAPDGVMRLSDASLARNTFKGKAVHAVTAGDNTLIVDNTFDLITTDGDINSYTPGCPEGLIIGSQEASFSADFCTEDDAIIGDQTASPSTNPPTTNPPPSNSPASFAFSDDFEGADATDGAAITGWTWYVNVFNGDTYQGGYGGSAKSNSEQISNISDEVGANQGTQVLNVYSDYSNQDHAKGWDIEVNLYREFTIKTSDSGEFIFEFDVKRPSDTSAAVTAPSVASAFVKVLDPANGFQTVSLVEVDTTSASSDSYSTKTISFSIDGATQAGLLIQFGFSNTATNYGSSGVLYDNVSVSSI
ncbi:hypothetical protein N9212_01555 [Luminiphilus sp.]|nr:hypothetical protein [Luminiphilus sp.]